MKKPRLKYFSDEFKDFQFEFPFWVIAKRTRKKIRAAGFQFYTANV